MRANDAIARLTGRKARGYRSPSWDLSEHTIDLLLAHGFQYDSSLMGADYLPYRARRGDYGAIEALPGGLEGWVQSRKARLVADHFASVFVDDALEAATLTSLAEGADLLLTGLIFAQPAVNVAEYYDIPLATLHFCPVRAHGQLLPFLPAPFPNQFTDINSPAAGFLPGA